jgi:AraC-like DNA-binding protein
MPIKYLLPKEMAKKSIISDQIPEHLEYMRVDVLHTRVHYECGYWGEILTQEISSNGQVYIEQYYSAFISIALEIHVERNMMAVIGMLQSNIKMHHPDSTLQLLGKKRSMHYIPAGIKLKAHLAARNKYRIIFIIPQIEIIRTLSPDYPILDLLLDAMTDHDAGIVSLPSCRIAIEDRNDVIRPRNGLLSPKAQFLFHCHRMSEFMIDYLEGLGDTLQNGTIPEKMEYQIKQLIAAFERHPERSADLKVVARELGVPPNTLAHFFKLIKHCPLSDFVVKLRIEKAKNLLRTTDKSIPEISILVGYEDASQFIRLFEKNIGYHPEMYRLSYTAGKERK